jgi:hypothetical protein
LNFFPLLLLFNGFESYNWSYFEQKICYFQMLRIQSFTLHHQRTIRSHLQTSYDLIFF